MFCSVFCMRCLPACSVRIHQVQPEMFNAYHRPCSIVKGLQKNVLDFTGQETPTSDLPYFWSILHMMDTHFCKSSIAQGQPGSMLCVTCCRVGFVFPEAIIIWPISHVAIQALAFCGEMTHLTGPGCSGLVVSAIHLVPVYITATCDTLNDFSLPPSLHYCFCSHVQVDIVHSFLYAKLFL